MRFVDLNAGIGSRTYAIESMFHSARCVGFSEDNLRRRTVYTTHYPNHPRLDLDSLSSKQKPIDLLISSWKPSDVPLWGREGDLFFYKILKAIKIFKPKYVLIDSFSNIKDFQADDISKKLGFDYVPIDSRLITPLCRDRLYWTNIKDVGQPEYVQTEMRRGNIRPHSWSGSLRKAGTYKIAPHKHFDERVSLGEINAITPCNSSNDSLTFFPTKYVDLLSQPSMSRRVINRRVINRRELFYYVIKEKYPDWVITPNEAEIVMGLPLDWTATEPTISSRLKFIGESSSIPVLKHVLSYINR